MGNYQPALRALFACESGLLEPEIGLERAFVLLTLQTKHDKAKFERCPFTKTIANCSNSFCHFHLISPVNRPQRPQRPINTARHSHILNAGKMYSVTSFISTYGLLSILNNSKHHAKFTTLDTLHWVWLRSQIMIGIVFTALILTQNKDTQKVDSAKKE
jgi:hypothetical protein